MVDLTISEGKLQVNVRGADKLWALKSSLEIPLEHVTGIRADPQMAKGCSHGVKFPGTNLPGVITAGTYYQDGLKVFWDVHHPERAIVIELRDESYDRLILEVEDPQMAVAMIEKVASKG